MAKPKPRLDKDSHCIQASTNHARPTWPHLHCFQVNSDDKVGHTLGKPCARGSSASLTTTTPPQKPWRNLKKAQSGNNGRPDPGPRNPVRTTSHTQSKPTRYNIRPTVIHAPNPPSAKIQPEFHNTLWAALVPGLEREPANRAAGSLLGGKPGQGPLSRGRGLAAASPVAWRKRGGTHSSTQATASFSGKPRAQQFPPRGALPGVGFGSRNSTFVVPFFATALPLGAC